MLSSYRIVDLTDGRGDFAGYVLAQLGAEVIAVEPPGGVPSRHWGPSAPGATHGEGSLRHWAYNRGKKSVRTDRVDLDALVATADVVIESGAIPVDLAAWRADNPTLITVSISPFGSDGPKAHWAASDLTLAAASGQAVVTGDHDRPPVRISEPQAFLHAGADAAVAVAAALVERSRSGLGQHLDVSAQQSLMAAVQYTMLAAAVGAPLNRRISGGLRIGPYELRFVYAAKDGHVSILFLFGDMIGRFTQSLMAWVHEEGFCSAELRDQDYISFFELIFADRLDPAMLQQAISAVTAFVASKTKAELFAGARERRLLIAPVATLDDVARFEQFAFNEYWDDVPVPVPGGLGVGVGERTVRFPGRWARAGVTPLQRLGPAPRLGEHEAEISAGLRAGATASAAPTAAAAASVASAARTAPVATAGTPATPARTTGARPAPGGERAADAARALDGLKVLDFSWVLAGPAATRLLADHGATVVRIETESRTDPMRASGPFMAGLGGPDDTVLWHCVAAGKYSLQLDLTTPEGRAVALDLARWADVVYESFTPGVLDAWGLGYEALRAVNSSVVMVSSSLMGQRGPYADFSGFGNLAAAITGFTEVTGWPDRAPAGPFTAYTDYVSPRFAALAMLGAFDHARRTGEGQWIDVSQAESSLQFLAPALVDLDVNGVVATRRGNADPRFAPHGIYPAGDVGEDRWIAIACTNDAHWVALSDVLARPDLASLTVAERHARSAELDGLISRWSSGQDPDALTLQLQDRRVPAHTVQHSPQCVADPQLQHREHFYQVPHPLHGQAWVEGPAVRLSRTPGRARWAGPVLGQHNHDVLSGLLGYNETHITDLVIAGAIH
ncbi:MAG: CoA transferase [Acidimicrobiales bacterium]